MERHGISRREFLKLTAVGTAAGFLVACGKRETSPTTLPTLPSKPRPTNTPPRAVFVAPEEEGAQVTRTPFQPIRQTPIETPKEVQATLEPTKAPERKISASDFDIGPFYPDFRSSFDVPAETTNGYGRLVIKIEEPMTVRGQVLTKKQIAVMKDYANHPFASLVYLTDNPYNPTHFVYYAHSGTNLGTRLPFEFMRRIALKDPQEIIGKKLTITQEFEKTIAMEFTFIDARVVSAEQWRDSIRAYPDKPEMPQFIWLEKLGIPYFQDKETLVTFTSCVNDVLRDKEGNPIKSDAGNVLAVPFSLDNNRLLFTAKLTALSEA